MPATVNPPESKVEQKVSGKVSWKGINNFMGKLGLWNSPPEMSKGSYLTANNLFIFCRRASGDCLRPSKA